MFKNVSCTFVIKNRSRHGSRYRYNLNSSESVLETLNLAGCHYSIEIVSKRCERDSTSFRRAKFRDSKN